VCIHVPLAHLVTGSPILRATSSGVCLIRLPAASLSPVRKVTWWEEDAGQGRAGRGHTKHRWVLYQ
jgi:hypothetical protein